MYSPAKVPQSCHVDSSFSYRSAAAQWYIDDTRCVTCSIWRYLSAFDEFYFKLSIHRCWVTLLPTGDSPDLHWLTQPAPFPVLSTL
jgi:hypothetical protein